MKKSLVLAIALAGASLLQAQKYCIVDVEYILSKMQAYKDAQAQLDKIAEGWQKEVETQMKEVDNAYRKFQAEQVLLTEQMKQQRIKEIEARERDIKEFQKSKFGPNGELFKKRQELIKPIQDKVYDELKKYAEAKGYDLILDKSSGPSLLYYSEKLNKSEDILAALGISKSGSTGSSSSVSGSAPSGK
jgi:outer membrane protein